MKSFLKFLFSLTLTMSVVGLQGGCPEEGCEGRGGGNLGGVSDCLVY